ncbi:MAG: hypothetical protein GX488_01705, partial [Clostridiales bacterium]|nr:hypothetical protein [Clostridiales bacterium]
MSDCKNILNEDEQAKEKCTAIAYQAAEVSVPVTVRPKAITGAVNTFCCGEPTIKPCPPKIICDTKQGTCSFILTQLICIEVAIEFSAEAFAGCPFVQCGEVSEDMC